MKVFSTRKEFEEFIKNRSAVLVYFSTLNCNVCKVLRPRVNVFIEKNFPRIESIFIDLEKHPDLSAQMGIFIVPTILIFFEGKELIRKSRNINFDEFFSEIERPYSMFFED